MKHANTGRNYAILSKSVKVEHEKKPELNLKSMQIVGFQQASTKFLRFLSCKNNFFIGKKTVVETFSVAIMIVLICFVLTYI